MNSSRYAIQLSAAMALAFSIFLLSEVNAGRGTKDAKELDSSLGRILPTFSASSRDETDMSGNSKKRKATESEIDLTDENTILQKRIKLEPTEEETQDFSLLSALHHTCSDAQKYLLAYLPLKDLLSLALTNKETRNFIFRGILLRDPDAKRSWEKGPSTGSFTNLLLNKLYNRGARAIITAKNIKRLNKKSSSSHSLMNPETLQSLSYVSTQLKDKDFAPYEAAQGLAELFFQYSSKYLTGGKHQVALPKQFKNHKGDEEEKLAELCIYEHRINYDPKGAEHDPLKIDRHDFAKRDYEVHKRLESLEAPSEYNTKKPSFWENRAKTYAFVLRHYVFLNQDNYIDAAVTFDNIQQYSMAAKIWDKVLELNPYTNDIKRAAISHFKAKNYARSMSLWNQFKSTPPYFLSPEDQECIRQISSFL